MAFVAFLIIMFRLLGNKFVFNMFDMESDYETIKVDEDLPKFFDTISYLESKKIIALQEHFKQYYSIEFFEWSVINRFERQQLPCKVL